MGNDEAVAQAEAQLKSAQAQDTNLGILRAQYEHAIAVLIGQPASSFSLPPNALTANPPAIPAGIPSELLERRPDIAAAERSVAQANAEIGVAKTAYFPRNPAQRLRWIWKFVGRELVYMAKPFLVGGPQPCRNYF